MAVPKVYKQEGEGDTGGFYGKAWWFLTLNPKPRLVYQQEGEGDTGWFYAARPRAHLPYETGELSVKVWNPNSRRTPGRPITVPS